MKTGVNQYGLSLVELMVAMTLGVLISAAALQLFLTHRQMFNLQQGIASVLEQGQFVVNFMSRELMSAGYGQVAAAIGTGEGESADGLRYDAIRIYLEEGKDCAGGTLNDGENPVANPWKHYAVTIKNGTGILICSDSDKNNNPLIDNVEAFQILYGISSDAGAITPNYYAPLSHIGSEKVVSIRFAVLLSSQGVTNNQNETIGQYATDRGSLQVLDQNYSYSRAGQNYLIDFEDRRLRRLFVSTVAIRNTFGG
ncbi:MAG: hypothetical protein CSA49_00285 [Gammaproteobacteria bacterium]|nr:MAG: hypothetical protein CSA49_00285 [Gammaproteobacteria bacterium]